MCMSTALLDGRDVPPSSGKDYVQECADKLKEIGVGKIATVMGRYYAMDRDNRWDRVEKAYAAMVYGEGVQAQCPVKAVADSYAKEVTDEFVVPAVCARRRSDRRRRFGGILQLPSGPGQGNHPHLCGSGLSTALSARKASFP